MTPATARHALSRCCVSLRCLGLRCLGPLCLGLLSCAAPASVAPAEPAEPSDAADAAGPLDVALPDAVPAGDADAAGDLASGPTPTVWPVLHAETGTFDLVGAGKALFLGVTADLSYRDAAGSHVRSLRDPGAVTAPDAHTLRHVGDGLTLTLAFDPQATAEIRLRLTVRNDRQQPITVDKLTPLLMRTEDGAALALGSDPRDVRILENGQLLVLDPTVQLVHGDRERLGLADLLPLDLRGNSISNWNHIVADPAHPERSIVAGFLSFDRCVPTLGIGMAPDAQPGAGGVRPFTVYAAENRYIFDGKPLAPGAELASELLWLRPFAPDPLAALEAYARDLAAQQGLVPWTQRGPGHPVPAGWNSWTGSGGSGGHGTDISEALILASLEVYRREFGSFGTNFFQIDEGWQARRGDWQFRPDRFPHGGKWLADQIVAAGFRPGLWVAAFSVDAKSQLAKTHPDWLQPKAPIVPAMLVSDEPTLDTSHPAVHAWLRALGAELRGQGWEWLKIDFSYWALLGDHPFDPSLTHPEAWRQAWQALRDGIGANAFVCGIGATGLNVGRVEGMRLTLDNGPEWNAGDPDDLLAAPSAFLPTVRTGSRRWFWQNRIWHNHDDLIFFRSSPEPDVKPLTFRESRAFATWIGLMASVVKIGDKLTHVDSAKADPASELASQPTWIDVLRRLTPIWPEGARPLDVLTKDQPEVFEQRIDAPAGKWTNLGLCNWGSNRDHATPTPLELPDGQTRTYTVHCPDDKPCAVYEFWSETYLGEKTAPFAVTVQPHDCQVLALRPLEPHPQLVGDSRHITQGAADLGPIVWDGAQNRLSTTLTAAVGSPMAPWSYHFAYRVPAGFDCPAAAVDGLDVPLVVQADGVAHLAFALDPSQAGQKTNVRLLCQLK